MVVLTQPPLQFWSVADHTRPLIPPTKGYSPVILTFLFYTVDAIPILVKYTKTKQMKHLEKYDGDMPNIMKLTVRHIRTYLGIRSGTVEVSILLGCGARSVDD